jgi:hypothetical protein
MTLTERIDKFLIKEFTGMEVAYDSERAGEPVFMHGGKKFQYCNGIYPNGKRDVTVYDFSSDLCYDYAQFRKNVLNIKESVNESVTFSYKGFNIEEIKMKDGSEDYELTYGDKSYGLFTSKEEAEEFVDKMKKKK